MEKSGIKKIAIVGAESTGKTWLCEALAKHYQTVWVPEYARDYFNDSDIYNYTLDDLVIIAQRQIELEQELLKKANRFLFCDTTLITLKIWAELEFKTCPDFILEHLNNMHYDCFFLTNNELPWIQDAQRQNKHSRDLLFEMNEKEIQKTLTPYSIIIGINVQRKKNAIELLNKWP